MRRRIDKASVGSAQIYQETRRRAKPRARAEICAIRPRRDRNRLGGVRRFCESTPMGIAMGADSGIAALARLIDEARRAVVFTGAGISTESGIPDFRSPGGIWTQMAPIYFDDFLASEEARRETWRRRFAMEDAFGAAEPNRGHRAVDALVRRGKVGAVITQNIDGLHQASGIPSEKIIELHGNTTYAACLDCGARHELGDIRLAFERDGTAPRCRRCKGFVKTATISFGQARSEERRVGKECRL